MTSPDPRITRFIGRHHVLSLATVAGDRPHCCSLFYAYDPARNLFAVTSAEHTLHVGHLQVNPQVAGAIALESRVIGKLQGIQLRGTMTRPATPGELSEVRKFYLGRFPFAVLMELELWVIRPDYLKLTDNRLGFGKKLLWEAVSGEEV